MAHRASLVHDQPILDAQFAVQLVTVVTFLRISAHFEANLTEQIVSEGLVDLEYCDGISIISDINSSLSQQQFLNIAKLCAFAILK